jgi:ribulose-phosphate 3-epimerase
MAGGRARVAASILDADLSNLAYAVRRVQAAGADRIHLDVMDAHFVPNLTIGPPVVRSLRRHSPDVYFDCHLMMDNPDSFLDDFKDAGANGCTVHVEIGRTDELIAQMRGLELDVGLAANPDMPFEAVEPFLDKIDLLLLMTVFPGFGGQSFIADVMPKVERARAEIDRRGLRVALQVDGGINEDTLPVAAKAGADTFVAGNAIFGADDPLAAARRLRALAR